MFGDDVLGSVNIKMVEVARSVGASSKFTGSGGAVVALCPDGDSQVEHLCKACESCSLDANGCGAVKFISFLVER